MTDPDTQDATASTLPSVEVPQDDAIAADAEAGDKDDDQAEENPAGAGDATDEAEREVAGVDETHTNAAGQVYPGRAPEEGEREIFDSGRDIHAYVEEPTATTDEDGNQHNPDAEQAVDSL